MASSSSNDLRSASPSEVLVALQSEMTLTSDQSRAALANAFERIATLEREWEELGRAFRWLHDHIGGTPPDYQ
jgi:hypothetical protein